MHMLNNLVARNNKSDQQEIGHLESVFLLSPILWQQVVTLRMTCRTVAYHRIKSHQQWDPSPAVSIILERIACSAGYCNFNCVIYRPCRGGCDNPWSVLIEAVSPMFVWHWNLGKQARCVAAREWVTFSLCSFHTVPSGGGGYLGHHCCPHEF